MAEKNNTIKTTAVLDVNQAQIEIVKLNGIASDTTKTLTERIDAKNKQIKIQNQLTKVTISQAHALVKGLSGVEGQEKTLKVAVRNLNKERLRATKLQVANEKSLNKLKFSLEKAKNGTNGLVSGFAMIGQKLMGSLGVIALLYKLIGAFKSFISTAKGFEYQNAKLAGVLDIPVNQTALLVQQAKDLGGIYPTLAKNVLKLQTAYARLGFTQGEIFDLTKDTIEGSYSLNTTLDHTALLVGAVVKAYDSLGASDAKEIIDQLTRSTQKSSLNFEALSIALPKVAGAASAMNIPLSKTLAELATAMNATQDASIAGTSYRKVIAKNAKANRTMAESLKTIREATNQVAMAQKMYGDRAFVVALALANQEEKTKSLAKVIKNSLGVAHRDATKKMDTYQGSVDRVRSAWERLTLTLNDSNRGLTAFFNTLAKIITFAAGKDTPNPFKNIDEGLQTNLAIYKKVVEERDNLGKYASKQEREQADLVVKFYAKAVEKWERLYVKKYDKEADGRKQQKEALDRLKKEANSLSLQEKKSYIELLKIKIKHQKLYGKDSIKTERELLEKQREYELSEKQRSTKEKLVIDKKYALLFDKLNKTRLDREKKAELNLISEELKYKQEHGKNVLKEQLLLLDKQKKLEIESKYHTEDEILAITKKYDTEKETLTNNYRDRDLSATIESENILLTKKKKAGEDTLLLQLNILEEEKKQELLNKNLTEEEKKNISDKYRQEEADAVLEHGLKMIDEQMNLDQLDIERRQTNHEYVLNDQLDFLNKQKERELLNTNLTEAEKQAIIKKYHNAEIKLKQESEKTKMALTTQTLTGFTSALGEAFGIQREAAVAGMMIAAPQAIGELTAKNHEAYPSPMAEIMSAIGIANVIVPIVKGLNDIRKVRFSKEKKSGGGGSLSVPQAPTTEAIKNLAANNAARLGEDQSIGANAGSIAANNVNGSSSVGVVFSENRYNDFKTQVSFKENKISI